MRKWGFFRKRRRRKVTLMVIICLGLLCFMTFTGQIFPGVSTYNVKDSDQIEWVDFDVPYEALKKAGDIDIESYGEEQHISWIDILAYLAAKYGGDFSMYKEQDMIDFTKKLLAGKSIKSLTVGMKYFSYYREAYDAVLGGLLGEYRIEDETGSWKFNYGLKAFSPIADGYWYTDSDDFGRSRSYGFDRKHFGHDLMVSTGTPVIAIEGGTVEAAGWNQYGGWRLGIRSFDKKRYYYYAHLRKDHPYNDKIYEGQTVNAGDVIGYSGQTGYSIKENVNNIDTPHLHVGLQLIFDEKEKDSPNQIWVDMYAITRLLSENKSPVYQDEKSKEHYRRYKFSEEIHYSKEASEETGTTLLSPKEINVPIIMYHSIVPAGKKKGEYVIDPGQLAADLKYLKKKGYNTLLMSDLINYVKHDKPLPGNPVVLTFDDGYYNNYYYAYPLLRQYNMRAVISIIGKFTDEFTGSKDENIEYSYLSWRRLAEMSNSGYVEIQNHSYNLHRIENGRTGITQKKGESLREYKKVLRRDVMSLQKKTEKYLGEESSTFTYPFGALSENSQKVINSMGFEASLGCEEGVNTLKKGDPDTLYNLKRFLRTPKDSVENLGL